MDTQNPSQPARDTQRLFDHVKQLMNQEQYEEALALMEQEETAFQNADMHQQILHNKFKAKALYEITYQAYVRDQDIARFEALFNEHRPYFEVHLGKKEYLNLMNTHEQIRRQGRSKQLKVLLPALALAFVVAGGLFLLFRPQLERMAQNSASAPPVTIADTEGHDQEGSADSPAVDEDPSFAPASDQDPGLAPEPALASPSEPAAPPLPSTPAAPQSPIASPADPSNAQPVNPSGTDSTYFFPGSDQRRIRPEEIRSFSKEELQRALHEIYARHGFSFSGNSKRYFQTKTWYEEDPANRDFKKAFRKLSQIEKDNVNLLMKTRDKK